MPLVDHYTLEKAKIDRVQNLQQPPRRQESVGKVVADQQANQPVTYPLETIAGTIDGPSVSSFYRLRPIGCGTAGVEAMTSYIQRLAEVHCVSPDMLRRHEYMPGICGSLSYTLKESGAVNGCDHLAKEWVDHLSPWMSIWELDQLTLIALGTLLPTATSMRSDLHWCPACLAEWNARGVPSYQPLLWCLSFIDCCLLHGCELATRCPNPVCNSRIPLLSRNTPVGYCRECKTWLGTAPVLPTASTNGRSIGWKRWLADATSKLMALRNDMDLMSPCCLLEKDMEALAVEIDIPGKIRWLITNTAAEDRAVFSKRTGIVTDLLDCWCSGHIKPRLDFFLILCGRLGVQPAQLIQAGTGGRPLDVDFGPAFGPQSGAVANRQIVRQNRWKPAVRRSELEAAMELYARRRLSSPSLCLLSRASVD